MYGSLGIFSSKRHEIMSRYRPIAPKPQLLFENAQNDNNGPHSPSPSPPRIRPGRPRKRGKTVISSSSSQSLQSHFTELSPYASSLPKTTNLGFSSYGFGQGLPSPTRRCGEFAAWPTLLCPFPVMEETALDLSSRAEIPQEKDFLQKLQTPFSGPNDSGTIVMPQPIRPIGSTIAVECISESSSSSSSGSTPVSKTPDEVEEDIESEALPSIISDSNNKVRVANSAYKELVGQPECPWLHSMVASKRISGEVVLVLLDSEEVPTSSNGFSCKVKIEWASNGHKIFINAACDVIRLACESKDYLFKWRFHTKY